MATASPKPKKPRIRKSVPTMREQAEAARTDAEKQKPKRIRKVASKAAAPLKKVRLPRNKATKPIYKIGSIVKKILRRLVPSYFLNSWREVKQVTWPSRVETWRLTLAVFIFSIIFGLAVYGVDKVLDLIFKKVILK